MPCIHQSKMWYVIPVTPRSRSIFVEAQVEDIPDPIISSEEGVEEDAIEVEEMEASPSSNHTTDDEEEGDDASSMGGASDDESNNFFVNLSTMGFDMDTNACRDLLADEN